MRGGGGTGVGAGVGVSPFFSPSYLPPGPPLAKPSLEPVSKGGWEMGYPGFNTPPPPPPPPTCSQDTQQSRGREEKGSLSKREKNQMNSSVNFIKGKKESFIL